jgi:hypothetical protein
VLGAVIRVLRAPARPPLIDRRQVQRRGDVHEHAHGEELHHALEGQAGQPLGELPQMLVPRPGSSPDLGIVARGVDLQLQQEQRPVIEKARVAVTHRFQRRFARAVAGRRDEGVLHSLEAPLDEREEQRLLGREQAEQVRLADPGVPGDILGGGARQAVDGELGDRGVEDQFAALRCGHPLLGLGHGH